MNLDLYTAATPNGHKASIALEEAGLRYRLHHVDLAAGDQRKPGFLVINPLGRIPVLVVDGFPIVESGAILLWVGNACEKLLPRGARSASLVIQWLMFQVSAVGPILGQAGIFGHLEERSELAIRRFREEGGRLLGFLDRRLGETEFLAGDYSIADIAHWCWVRHHEWAGIDIVGMNNLGRWLEAVAARPAVRRGLIEQAPRPAHSFTGAGGEDG